MAELVNAIVYLATEEKHTLGHLEILIDAASFVIINTLPTEDQIAANNKNALIHTP